MTYEKTNKAIILRNIDSDVIEEIILVYKTDEKIDKVNPKSIQRQKRKVKFNKPYDFLLEEAESVINDYILKNNYNVDNQIRILKKNKLDISFFINIGLVLSLALFILLILKVI